MTRRLRQPLQAALLGAALCATASADTSYDEGINGDLSGSGATPTPVSFDLGSNLVTGSMIVAADTRDYLTFTVPDGAALVALNQIEYIDIATGGTANVGYHALRSGATAPVPGFGTANDFLGGSHVGPLPSGFDLLPGLAAAVSNGTGFTVPLGPGTYTYLIQQTSPDLTGYSLEFVIEELNDWTDEGCSLDGTLGAPLLSASGQLIVGANNEVVLSNTVPGSNAGLFLAFASNPAPFKGGTLKPVPWIGDLLIVPTSGAGTIPLAFSLPSALPPGTELWVQWAVQDAGAINGIALSNAVKGTAP